MKLPAFSPNAFLASAAASPTSVVALDGLESSTHKLCQLFTFNTAVSASTSTSPSASTSTSRSTWTTEIESPTSVAAVDKHEHSTQKLCHLFTSAASATEKKISDCNDALLIEGVDHFIAGKTDKEARAMLSRMILDLMHEVDDYRGSNQEARDLMLALEEVIGVQVEFKHDIETLSTAEATDLVVYELSKKIEKLNVEIARLRVNDMRKPCVNEMRKPWMIWRERTSRRCTRSRLWRCTSSPSIRLGRKSFQDSSVGRKVPRPRTTQQRVVKWAAENYTHHKLEPS
jgi:hypothetical protein